MRARFCRARFALIYLRDVSHVSFDLLLGEYSRDRRDWVALFSVSNERRFTHALTVRTDCIATALQTLVHLAFLPVVALVTSALGSSSNVHTFTSVHTNHVKAAVCFTKLSGVRELAFALCRSASLATFPFIMTRVRMTGIVLFTDSAFPPLCTDACETERIEVLLLHTDRKYDGWHANRNGGDYVSLDDSPLAFRDMLSYGFVMKRSVLDRRLMSCMCRTHSVMSPMVTSCTNVLVVTSWRYVMVVTSCTNVMVVTSWRYAMTMTSLWYGFVS